MHKIDTLNESSTNDSSQDSENQTLTITSLNVGQGDSTLLKTPDGKYYLIDAGPPQSGHDIINPYLDSKNIQLDGIFVSHYDADHYGAVTEVLSGVDGEMNTPDDQQPTIYDRGGTPQKKDSLLESYLELTAPYRKDLNPGDRILIGGRSEDEKQDEEQDDEENKVSITCLISNGILPDGSGLNMSDVDEENENERSMGLLIEYGNFRYWTSGDLTGGGLQTHDAESLVAPLIGEVDLLHINHHGSLTSSNPSFLDTLQPKVAIISAGTHNTYGHPAPEVLSRLLDQNIQLYITSPFPFLDPDLIEQATESITVEVGPQGLDYHVFVNTEL